MGGDGQRGGRKETDLIRPLVLDKSAVETPEGQEVHHLKGSIKTGVTGQFDLPLGERDDRRRQQRGAPVEERFRQQIGRRNASHPKEHCRQA